MTERPEGQAVGHGGPLHRFLRWTYARWVQVLAHGDALGKDKRPSGLKIAGYLGALYAFIHASDPVIVVSMGAIGGRGLFLAAIGSWRGISTSVTMRSESRKIIEQRDPDLGIDPAP